MPTAPFSFHWILPLYEAQDDTLNSQHHSSN